MAIYPDKKNGSLTGRWRVELQRGKERYRKRWDSHAEAVADEKAVLASWSAGEALPAPGQAPGAPQVHTLATILPKARGVLWAGDSAEKLCWERMDILSDILGPNTRLDDIDTVMVDGMAAELRKRGRTDATINRYKSHLSKFLKWAKTRKYRTLPVRGEDGVEFSKAKESRGRIRWITTDEQKAIGEFLTTRGGDFADEAAAVWDFIEIAIESGCRRTELREADLKQIGKDRLHLWETKTDNPRTVPLRPETATRLRRLVQSGRMPTERGLRSWWHRIRKHLGLLQDRDFVLHACRHTCATRMVDADVNVFVIKEWMGHKCIETTLRYAHVKPKNLEDALVKVGNHLRLVSQEPQKAGLSNDPTLFPTSGGMDVFDQAA